MEQTSATLVEAISQALMPLARALGGDEERLREYVEELGWTLPTVPQILKDLQDASNQLVVSLAQLEAQRRRVGEGSASEDNLSDPATSVTVDLALLAAAIREVPPGLRDQLPADFVAATRIDEQFQRRLFDHALSRYLEFKSHDVYLVSQLLGLVEAVPHAADPVHFQPAFVERVIRWDRLPLLATDPTAIPREVYGWGTPDLDSGKLTLALRDLSFALNAPGFFDYLSQPLALAAAPGLGNNASGGRGLVIPLFADSPLELHVGLYPIPKQQPGEFQGLMNTFTAVAEIEESIEITPALTVNFNSELDLALGLALAFWPDRPPKLLGNIGTAAGALVEGANATLGVRYAPPDESERLPLLSFTGLQLDARAFSLEAGVGMGANGSAEAYLQAGLPGLRFQLGGLGQDSFLARLLPDSLALEFDLSVGWSIARGLYWQNSAGTKFSIPIVKRIGPVQIDSLDIVFASSGEKFQLALCVSASSQLGPLFVQVEGLGIAFALDSQGGNLGPIDLGFSAVPPRGIGLIIDAAVVVGGGYLFFDAQKEEYGGILQLEIAETIAVKAIGLLTTRMPDGSKGFSLVVIIAAEGFPPIQLGFGFTLTGIGGLLGVNRTVMVDVLRSGLKNGTLGSILFPDDPIRNAPQIVSDLRAVFPPVKDRYVFGPMAIIGWGTPAILTLEIGLILELPEPVRLIILGRLRALLPDEEHALVQVRMDAIGVIDFNQGEVSLDATLYDSRILAFVLTGDMALRANWGAQPNFILAIGGFNPRFPAPAGFPQLVRLALSLGDSDNPRLRFESYLALTSNTVQFGARLDFSYSAAGFTLAGFLGFDALFQFAPFEFIADVGAMVALKRGNSVLMGVFLDITLAGPTPWHVWGEATFKVLIFKVSIRFDHRFGHEEPPALPEPIDVLTLLADALGDRRNWSSALPRGEPAIVSVRDSATTPATQRVHPLAQLTVRQRVVPLNRPLTRFGNAPLAGGTTTFTVAASGIDNTQLHMPSTMVRDAFALAQYQEMSDEEKLARPAFETQDAGLQFGVEQATYQYETLTDTAISYDTLIIDPTRPAEKQSEPYVLPQTVLDAVVILGAAGQAAIRRSGSARYRAMERAA